MFVIFYPQSKIVNKFKTIKYWEEQVQERRGGEIPELLLEKLKQLEREAFVLLIDERLAANESFRIFTDLISRIRVELKTQQD
jgi:hypothetical protein